MRYFVTFLCAALLATSANSEELLNTTKLVAHINKNAKVLREKGTLETTREHQERMQALVERPFEVVGFFEKNQSVYKQISYDADRQELSVAKPPRLLGAGPLNYLGIDYRKQPNSVQFPTFKLAEQTTASSYKGQTPFGVVARVNDYRSITVGVLALNVDTTHWPDKITIPLSIEHAKKSINRLGWHLKGKTIAALEYHPYRKYNLEDTWVFKTQYGWVATIDNPTEMNSIEIYAPAVLTELSLIDRATNEVLATLNLGDLELKGLPSVE